MQTSAPREPDAPSLLTAPTRRWGPDRWFPVRAVDSYADLSVALYDVVADSMPVITVVGGAAGAGAATDADRAVYEEILLSAARFGAAVFFGGTDSGCLAEVGRAKRRLLAEERLGPADAPLIGVVAEGTVAYPGTRYDPNEKAPLQPDQDLILLVPGKNFGDESWALAQAGRLLSRGQGSATVLINGGGITVQDATHRVRDMTENGRPVQDAILLAYRGSGRAADDIIAAKENGGGHRDPRINTIAAHSGTRAFDSAGDLRRQFHAHFTAVGHTAREPGVARTARRAPEVTVPPLSLPAPSIVAGLTPMWAYDLGRMTVGDTGPRHLRQARTDPDLHRAWREAGKASRVAALKKLRQENSGYAQDDRTGDVSRSIAAFHAGVREAFWRAHDAIRDGDLGAPGRFSGITAKGFGASAHASPLRPGDAEPVNGGSTDWSRVVMPSLTPDPPAGGRAQAARTGRDSALGREPTFGREP
ncbi:hypothetical protein [Embleya sp. MST-111070]|uniref:hypothetical protein n=1 Tax=Embleya sp. MST-111070 TaxID=3398231 RepID=UPI003F73141C